jgi:hypothetical protein
VSFNPFSRSGFTDPLCGYRDLDSTIVPLIAHAPYVLGHDIAGHRRNHVFKSQLHLLYH